MFLSLKGDTFGFWNYYWIPGFATSLILGVSSCILHIKYQRFINYEFPGRPTAFVLVLPILTLVLDGFIIMIAIAAIMISYETR